ncbi:MAG TPA: hypothetical protein DDZ88_21505 [Verrucomicrobiales bacterium]|nr:hypothetical protein [Verrucomicrobiales bacterium]
MKRQNYFPNRLGEQPEWLGNFATKLPIHAAALGLAAPRVTAGAGDALWAAYVIGDWRINAQGFADTVTDAVAETHEGTGAAVQVLPVFTVPALPAGVVAVLPGAVERLFRLVKDIKNAPGYTDVIGSDLGIIGPEVPPPPPGGGAPRIKLFVEQGAASQITRMTFFKDGHQGLHIESRVGSGAWEFLAIDTVSPYLDERPLQVPGQAEVREYRARFWDNGQPNGNWCDVAKVTVGP